MWVSQSERKTLAKSTVPTSEKNSLSFHDSVLYARLPTQIFAVSMESMRNDLTKMMQCNLTEYIGDARRNLRVLGEGAGS